MVLTSVLGTLKFINLYEGDTDVTDKLNSFITTNVLIAFSILVSWKQFGGKPIECLVPDTFSGAWEQVIYIALNRLIIDHSSAHNNAQI